MTTKAQRQWLCFRCIKPMVFFSGCGKGEADSHLGSLVQTSEGRRVIAGFKHCCVSAGVVSNNFSFW